MKRSRLLTCGECDTVLGNKCLCKIDGNVYYPSRRCSYGIQRKPKTCMVCPHWIQDTKCQSQYGACDIEMKQYSYNHECWNAEV